MTDNLLKKLEELDATKWLDYAFHFLTGISLEASHEECIDGLRTIGYSDEFITRFCTEASYTFNKHGKVVMMLSL